MTSTGLPPIIQGGMGVGVSSHRLANAVAREGALGVVSGTALDVVIARRLQMGDGDGSVRRALAAFPWPEMAQRVRDKYFVPGGKPEHAPFVRTPSLRVRMERAGQELLAVANFVEVFLAKEGHDGDVGINYLEKIQLPTLPSLFGAMAAGVGTVLMGAGIPLAIPGALDGLAQWEPAQQKLSVTGAERGETFVQHFDPRELVPAADVDLKRPDFLAIVASEVVAKTMLRRATGDVNGFVVEGHRAGGHNAPPRGGARTPEGESPAFGPRDEPRLDAFRKLDRPFWLAGAHASPDGLREAREQGAVGIQVGTIFALSEESGIRADLKRQLLERHAGGELTVRTDFRASPTGYPFKLVELPGTTADPAVVAARPRICDLGFLREAYRDDDGSVSFRCAGEPLTAYLGKGGSENETVGKQCLCNGLVATIGLGQTRRHGPEPAMVTAGEDLTFLEHVRTAPSLTYTASEALRYLRS